MKGYHLNKVEEIYVDGMLFCAEFKESQHGFLCVSLNGVPYNPEWGANFPFKTKESSVRFFADRLFVYG